jgi:chaperone modulatory protein CbpM
MHEPADTPLRGELVEVQLQFTLLELCRCSQASQTLVVELVEHGVLEPSGTQPAAWCFAGESLALTRRAQRLIDDLGVNVPGAALVMALLAQIRQLEQQQR